MTWHSRLVTLAILGAASSLGAQATRISAPDSDYLLEVTAAAAAKSPIGDLRASRVAAQDIELRFWSGYGLTGTRGLILRRRSGAWTAQAASLETCSVTVPQKVADTLSHVSEAAYLKQAFEQCANDMSGAGGVVLEVDRIKLGTIAWRGDLDSLWNSLLVAGLAQLPPTVKRAWMMLDGQTFVVELRQGNEYRASVIECTAKADTEADRQVQASGALLAARFADAQWLLCWCPRPARQSPPQ